MADFTADFEAGVNGNPITTGAGEASASAWTGIDGAPTYSNTHVAHGSLAGRFDPAGSDACNWLLSGDPADHYGRVYAYVTANPSSAATLLKIFKNAGYTVYIIVNTDGTIHIQDNGAAHSADSSASISLNQLIRIEYHVIHSATVGQIEVKLFNTSSSSSPTETLTSPANWDTGSAAGQTFPVFGARDGGWAAPIWLDDIVANATSYPGPVAGGGSAPVNSVPPVASGTYLLNHTLSCDTGTWDNSPTSYAYQWKRDASGSGSYSDIGSATSATYALVAADVGCHVECVVTATNASGSASATSNALGLVRSSRRVDPW